MSRATLTFGDNVVILSQPKTPLKEETHMSNPSTVIDETSVTPTKRDQQRARDAQAWETYLLLGSWVAVASELNYANGSCARRAGLRHATRNNLLVQDDTPPVV
jgi:hypothetical protein